MSKPWGVHAIREIYQAGCQAGLPDGRWAFAVAEPYTANRLVAAWWVLTGRAYALQWPKAGDLERALGHEPKERASPLGNQFKHRDYRSGSDGELGRHCPDPHA